MDDIRRDPITGIRPLGNRILVKQDDWDAKVGSIFIPQDHRLGFKDIGTVRAVGPKCTSGIKPGDRVLFSRQPASAALPDWREGDPNGWYGLLFLKEDKGEFLVVTPEA